MLIRSTPVSRSRAIRGFPLSTIAWQRTSLIVSPFVGFLARSWRFVDCHFHGPARFISNSHKPGIGQGPQTTPGGSAMNPKFNRCAQPKSNRPISAAAGLPPEQ
jgi:hypothetical protein